MYEDIPAKISYAEMAQKATPKPIESDPETPKAFGDLAKATEEYAAASDNFIRARRHWIEKKDRYQELRELADRIANQENA